MMYSSDCRANVLQPPDIHQVLGRAAAGGQGRTEKNVRSHHTGSARRDDDAAMEAASLRCCLPPYHRAGKEEVWTDRLEHSVRVQRSRLHHHNTVHSKPSRRCRPEES